MTRTMNGYGPDGLGGPEMPAETSARRGFDGWLAWQLHRLYDSVLAEPIPENLLRKLSQFERPSAALEEEGEEG